MTASRLAEKEQQQSKQRQRKKRKLAAAGAAVDPCQTERERRRKSGEEKEKNELWRKKMRRKKKKTGQVIRCCSELRITLEREMRRECIAAQYPDVYNPIQSKPIHKAIREENEEGAAQSNPIQ